MRRDVKRGQASEKEESAIKGLEKRRETKMRRVVVVVVVCVGVREQGVHQ